MKKNLLNKIILSGALLLAPTLVNAKSANIAIDGQNTANLNDTITFNVKINNIDDANIVALGGDIFYDSEYLTLVNTKSLSKNYKFDGNQISDNNYRIAGVDYTMENGITTDSIVYSLVFKTLKDGSTEVLFKNAELVNVDETLVNATMSNKALNIVKSNENNTNIIVNNSVENTNVNKNIKETVKLNNNVKEIINPVIINKESVVNNIEKISIIDRLNPIVFNKEVKGLTIDNVNYYSIYNYKKEN